MAKVDSKYKKGTILEIIVGGLPNLPYINRPRQVEEHIFKTPPIPDHKDILYADLPKSEQYWKRIQYPKSFYDYVPDVTQYSELDPEYIEVIECMKMDKERRKNGLWIMINGVPNFISGNFYFHLQWGNMKNGEPDEDGNSYPEYRKFQRDFFYFIELCKHNEDCLGGFIAKSKKVGVTQMCAAMYCNEATLYEKKIFGLMSKKGDECEGTNMAMIFYILENIPKIILPTMGKNSTMSVSFSHAPQKPTGTKQYQKKMKDRQDKKVLNSSIIGLNTTIDGFDGNKYFYIWLDEFPKYLQSAKISPKKMFEKNSAGVKLQQKITGKIWITSYTPEVDDMGFMEAKQIYYESKKSTIKQEALLKRTKSNLFCYHISSLYATEGTFDKYGEADVEKAFRLNDDERQAVKDDVQKYQSLIRQQARNEDESWSVGGSGSIFDNIRLQLSMGEKERMDFMKTPYYRRGNLEWTGLPLKSEVVFVPSENGRWYMTRLIDPNKLNTIFWPEEEGEDIYPGDTITFCGGIDPFSYMDTDETGKKGSSKGASYTLALPNMAMDNYYQSLNPLDFFSKRIISFYSERPANANDFLDDMIKETIYFGKMVLIEANKEWMIKFFKDKGLKRFLLLKNTETKLIEKYSPLKKQKEKSTQTGDVDEICRVIDEYITKPKGNDPDLCLAMEDVELISQLMSFDPTNTKRFDKVMAFGYAILALNSFSVLKKVRNKSKVDISKVAMAMLG